MWYRKGIYGILLIIGILFAILYQGSFSLMLLCILLLVPAILYLLSWYQRYHLHSTLINGGEHMLRGQAHTVVLSVEQKGLFPIGSAAATLVCTNLISGQKEQIQLCFPIPARNTVQITIQIIPEHCGMTQVQLAELQIWDYLHLWSRKIRRAAVFTAAVCPAGEAPLVPIPHTVQASERPFPTAQPQKNEADPSEICGVRSYQPGDRMNRIHWKLSSRQEQILVKEYASPVQNAIQLLLLFPKEILPEQLDLILEAACTFSLSLLQAGISHTLFFQTEQQITAHCKITNRKQLWEGFRQILSSCFSQTEKPAESLQNCQKQIPLTGSSTWILTTQLPDFPDSVSSSHPPVRCLLTDCPSPAPNGCFPIRSDAISQSIEAALTEGEEVFL